MILDFLSSGPHLFIILILRQDSNRNYFSTPKFLIIKIMIYLQLVKDKKKNSRYSNLVY